jgi:Putative Ig domain
MRFFRFLALVLAPALLLSGCATETPQAAQKLDIKVDTLPPAYINEDYTATIRAVGGLTPYEFKLEKGTLPPGLSLQGGEIRGTPTKEGESTFTISVSDGNLSSTFEDYTLNVTKPPPAQLTLNVPLTEIQRAVTLRGQIKEARGLQGFRSLIKWDASLFKLVPNSLKRNNEAFLLFYEEAEGQLRIDVGMVGGTLSGDRQVFEFALEPLKTSTLQLQGSAEFIGTNSTHSYAEINEGTAPQTSQDDNSNPTGQDGSNP